MARFVINSVVTLFVCGLVGRANSQPCLYNYTIGTALPVIITQTAPVCLICSDTANSQWAISGFSNPSPIPSAPYILYVTSPATMFIGGPQVGCYSTGGAVTIVSTVDIAVPVQPQVVTYVNEMDTLNLICSNVITVSSSVVALMGQSWYNSTGSGISTQVTYSLSSASRLDAGVYTCITKLIPNANNVANISSSTLVVVYYAPTAVISQASPIYVPQSLSIQLNCTFDGLPVPNVTWISPNGSTIISQSRFIIQSTNTSTSLTISSLVGGADNGTYICRASNSRGVSSRTVQLNVQVPPDSPSKLVVVRSDTSSLSLSWTNGFDGYSPLTSVLISYEVDRYPGEGTGTQNFTTLTSATLVGLHGNSTYTIHVQLVNAIGLISNPTTITQATVYYELATTSYTTSGTTITAPTNSAIPFQRLSWMHYMLAACVAGGLLL